MQVCWLLTFRLCNRYILVMSRAQHQKVVNQFPAGTQRHHHMLNCVFEQRLTVVGYLGTLSMDTPAQFIHVAVTARNMEFSETPFRPLVVCFGRHLGTYMRSGERSCWKAAHEVRVPGMYEILMHETLMSTPTLVVFRTGVSLKAVTSRRPRRLSQDEVYIVPSPN
jgi:hypothetical protein